MCVCDLLSQVVIHYRCLSICRLLPLEAWTFPTLLYEKVRALSVYYSQVEDIPFLSLIPKPSSTVSYARRFQLSTLPPQKPLSLTSPHRNPPVAHIHPSTTIPIPIHPSTLPSPPLIPLPTLFSCFSLLKKRNTTHSYPPFSKLCKDGPQPPPPPPKKGTEGEVG